MVYSLEEINETGIYKIVPNATSGTLGNLLNTNFQAIADAVPPPQVNADWDATDGVAEILNKPTIPDAQVNSDWDATSGVAEILNKPDIQPIATDTTITDDNGNVGIPNLSISNCLNVTGYQGPNSILGGTVFDSISVDGSSSLDNGNITTDGSGNLTILGQLPTPMPANAGINTFYAGMNLYGADAEVSVILDADCFYGNPLRVNAGGTDVFSVDNSGNVIAGNVTASQLNVDALDVVNASSLDNGNITTDGSGDLTAANITTSQLNAATLGVSGTTRLDNGLITTDGNGDLTAANITVLDTLTAGGLGVVDTTNLDNGLITTDGSGNINAAGVNLTSEITIGTGDTVLTSSSSSFQDGLVTIDDSGLSGDVAVINDVTNTNILDIRDGFIFNSQGQDVQNGSAANEDYSWGIVWDTGNSGFDWGVSNQFDLVDFRDYAVLMAYRSTANVTDGLAGYYEDAGNGYNCNGYVTAELNRHGHIIYGNYIFTPTTTVIDPTNGNEPLTIPDMSFANGSGLNYVSLDGAGNFSGNAGSAGVANYANGAYYCSGNAATASSFPQAAASTSVSNTAGSIYFNTATNHFMGYDGSSWKQLDN